MIRHYIKVALRNLIRSKGFSFINIFGLATGMTTCMLIILYVVDESGYDKHHQEGHRLYRIASEVAGEKWVATPAPMAEGLKKDLPEVEQSARLLRFPGAEKMLLKYEQNQKQFFETNAYYVDSTFFQLFSYDFKFGDIGTALNGPNTIVISEEVATKFFAHENPVDKVLKVGLPFGEFDYTVKGVFKNAGRNSHIPANLFLSMVNQDVGGWVKMQTKWATNSIFHTYVKLKEGADARAFENKLGDFLNRNGGEEFKAAGFEKKLFIQPVEDIYLHSDYGYEVAPNGNIKYLYIFGSIAAFVLLIACINFMNLSTARSEKRAKEVGIRKVNGTNRSSLVAQFLGESLMMSGLALCLTIAMIQLLIPVFNQLTDKKLSLGQTPTIFIGLTALTVLTGLLAGLYPAFYLSSFKPISVLKGMARGPLLSGVTIRKMLVVFQFSISVALILGAILISQQMEFMSSRNLGFDKSQKIILPIQTSEANAGIPTLKNELLNNSQVISVAKGGTYPGIESVTSMLFYAEGKPATENVEFQTIYAEPGYIETLDIELLSGREFAQEFKNDEDALILNETAIKSLGYTTDHAIGNKAYYDFENTTRSMNIIGVVKDFHFQGLQRKIKPLALAVNPIFTGPTNYLIVNVKGGSYAGLIATFKNAWNKLNPNSPFYSFLDQDFQKNYEKEERTSQLIQYFTIIAIVIACLGLFGLATFCAEQRIKEIGVRKVLGAGASQIVMLLSKDFIKLVLIAIVISSPVAYYLMNKWLQDFAYRIEIQWWVFVVAAAGAVLIALLTIIFQALKSAWINPVKSLRSE